MLNSERVEKIVRELSEHGRRRDPDVKFIRARLRRNSGRVVRPVARLRLSWREREALEKEEIRLMRHESQQVDPGGAASLEGVQARMMEERAQGGLSGQNAWAAENCRW